MGYAGTDSAYDPARQPTSNMASSAPLNSDSDSGSDPTLEANRGMLKGAFKDQLGPNNDAGAGLSPKPASGMQDGALAGETYSTKGAEGGETT